MLRDEAINDLRKPAHDIDFLTSYLATYRTKLCRLEVILCTTMRTSIKSIIESSIKARLVSKFYPARDTHLHSISCR